jgi:phosphate starvation-inducible PhoH-like protein
MQEELGLGFLGGTLQEKVKPLAYPVLDNLASFMPEQQAEFLLNNGRIEVLPMAMLRGRSLNNAFIIADE